MRNRRAILIGILCVLSVVSAAYGQAPSDSGVITVTKDIDVSKLAENVEELNRNMKTLTETITKLEGSVTALNTTVVDMQIRIAGIERDTKNNTRWQYVILAGIFGPLLLSVYEKRKRNKDDKTTSTQVVQPNQSTAAATNPAPISEDKTAPSPTVPSKFPEGKELEDYLKSDTHAASEKV